MIKLKEDSEIVDLFLQRDSTALSFLSAKYSHYAHTVGYNILKNREDTEECFNDALAKTWDSIPPARPNNLKAYFSTIMRNLSLNKYNSSKALKRGGNTVDLALDELAEIVGADEANDDENGEIKEILNNFLDSLKDKQRNVFVSRYWHLKNIEEIATDYNLSETNVKQLLFRGRKKLKAQLEQRGIYHA